MEIGELNILYEDNHIIVVLKPQMVASCPDESGDSNLFDCVKQYIKVTYNKAGNAFLGLVHRLDRPTGGVMVFAKTSKAAARLSEQMRSGGFEKKYYAVLCGTPSKKKDSLENYLRKNSVNNTVYVATQSEEGAKYAKLDYEIKATERGLSLAEITLHTGRTHQIRAHMSFIGCPVLGDSKYGDGAFNAKYNAKRQRLTKTARPRDQRHNVSVFPPFFNKQGLIHVKNMLCY